MLDSSCYGLFQLALKEAVIITRNWEFYGFPSDIGKYRWTPSSVMNPLYYKEPIAKTYCIDIVDIGDDYGLFTDRKNV